jgi:hypothetical protein
MPSVLDRFFDRAVGVGCLDHANLGGGSGADTGDAPVGQLFGGRGRLGACLRVYGLGSENWSPLSSGCDDGGARQARRLHPLQRRLSYSRRVQSGMVDRRSAVRRPLKALCATALRRRPLCFISSMPIFPLNLQESLARLARLAKQSAVACNCIASGSIETSHRQSPRRGRPIRCVNLPQHGVA